MGIEFFPHIYCVHLKIVMQIMRLRHPHIMWIRVIMRILHFALTECASLNCHASITFKAPTYNVD